MFEIKNLQGGTDPQNIPRKLPARLHFQDISTFLKNYISQKQHQVIKQMFVLFELFSKLNICCNQTFVCSICTSKFQVVINCSHHTYAFCTKCVLINIFLQFLYKSMNMYNCIECNFLYFHTKDAKFVLQLQFLKAN